MTDNELFQFYQHNHICVYPSKHKIDCADCTNCINHYIKYKDNEPIPEEYKNTYMDWIYNTNLDLLSHGNEILNNL